MIQHQRVFQKLLITINSLAVAFVIWVLLSVIADKVANSAPWWSMIRVMKWTAQSTTPL